MKKEIIKNQEGTEITVLIELKKRTLARDPRMTFTTRMVKTMLENDKIKNRKKKDFFFDSFLIFVPQVRARGSPEQRPY